MSPSPRHLLLVAAAAMTLAASGCATTPGAPALAEGSQATVEGTIASIDTQPWMYDGNAVVVLDTAAHGPVRVQLPARWNLCKAGQVDVASLAVGHRARAVGTVGPEQSLVVCELAGQRLEHVD